MLPTNDSRLSIAVSAMMAVFSIPMMLLNFGGGLVGGIWLMVLGIWKPIFVTLGILCLGQIAIGYLMMPSLLFVMAGAKSAERGRTPVGVLAGSLALIYTGAIMVGWAFIILKGLSRMGPDSAQWPLMLLSYGAATGPWASIPAKEQAAQGGASPAAVQVFFLSAGYIIAAATKLLAVAEFKTCLWILIVTIVCGVIFQLACMATEGNRFPKR